MPAKRIDHTKPHKVEDAPKSGTWADRLIPRVDTWLNRHHGEVIFYLIQMLTGDECFRVYFLRFKIEDTLKCSVCKGVAERAEQVFFMCPHFNSPQ